MVGTAYEAVSTGVATTYIGSGTWMSGVDRNVSRVRSFHGAVLATVFDTTPRPD